MNKTKEFLGKPTKEVFVEIDILHYLVKGLMLHWAWFMAFLLLLMSSVGVSIVIFLIWRDSLWFYFFPSLPGDIPNHWEPICQTCGWKHSCCHLWFSCSICMSSEAAWKACVWVGICFIIIFNLLTANTLQGSDGKIFFQMLWASLEAVILKIHSSTLSGSIQIVSRKPVVITLMSFLFFLKSSILFLVFCVGVFPAVWIANRATCQDTWDTRFW